MMDTGEDGPEVDMNHMDTQDDEPKEEHNSTTIVLSRNEAFRVTSHSAPCKSMQKKVMMQEVADPFAERINMCPAKEGTLEHCSPNDIVNKQCLDFNEHFQHGFGENSQAHHQNTPTNGNVAREDC